MTEAGTGPLLRRILVALDASERSEDALDEAARLAAALQAELVGLFIEDTELLQAAELPVTRIVSHQTPSPGALDAAMMQRALRIWAAASREALAAAASRWHVRWSYQITRGALAERLLAEATEHDVLAFTSAGLLRRALAGADAPPDAGRRAVSLYLARRRSLPGRPVVVLYQSAEEALAVGRALAKRGGGALVVLALGRDAEAAAALEGAAKRALAGGDAPAEVKALVEPDAAGLVEAIAAERPGVVVFDRGGSMATRIERVLDTTVCSTLVLG